MILVGQMDSPFVRRVAVTLNLYAMPFEREIISVYGDADAVRKINPLGKVPAVPALTHLINKRPELFPGGGSPALAELRMRAEELTPFRASPFMEE